MASIPVAIALGPVASESLAPSARSSECFGRPVLSSWFSVFSLAAETSQYFPTEVNGQFGRPVLSSWFLVVSFLAAG